MAVAGWVGWAGRVAASPAGRVAVAALALARLVRRRDGETMAGTLEVVRRARFLADRSHRSQALALLRRAGTVLGGRDEACLLTLEAAVTGLDDGRGVSAWRQGLDALPRAARLADRAWEDGNLEAVGEVIDTGLRLAFHPEVQFGEVGVTEDRLAGLRLLEGSRAFRAMTALRAGADPLPGAPAASGPPEGADPRAGAVADAPGPGADLPETGGRPHRLVVLALGNFTFARGIIADYEADPRCEVRVVDLALTSDPASPAVGLRLPRRRDHVMARVRGLGTGHVAALACTPALTETLVWADTVLVEWGSAAAAWASHVVSRISPRQRPRLVVRLHSYEASTPWPTLTDYCAVDTLITVAPAIRALLEETVPQLAPAPGEPAVLPGDGVGLPDEIQPGRAACGTTVLTLPNRAELTRFRLPKTDSAPHTLAMVGWASPRKDPLWALDLLDELRSDDPRWRLLLIGPSFPADPPPAQARYAAEVMARIEALGEAVEISGRTEDVPTWLTRAGVIVSASRREGTHEGFIEGVASGALPVCRRWPDLAAWGGPQALFPEEWVVDTPAQGAQRVRAAQATGLGQAGARASDLLIGQRDWAHVRTHYDHVLLGTAWQA